MILQHYQIWIQLYIYSATCTGPEPHIWYFPMVRPTAYPVKSNFPHRRAARTGSMQLLTRWYIKDINIGTSADQNHIKWLDQSPLPPGDPQSSKNLDLQYIVEMRVSQSFCFFMAVMLLLHQPVAAKSWQGTGTFESSNLTEIWSQIDANFETNANADTIQAFCTALSTNLNGKWDPAWNIVVVKIGNSGTPVMNDAVLYGYAFRNHWMWFNGWTHTALFAQQYSFVIWKDYNCQGWKNIGDNAAAADQSTGFSTDQQSQITNMIRNVFTAGGLDRYLWSQAKNLVDEVQASSYFVIDDNHAYSIVLTQSFNSTYMYGRVCMVDSNFYYSSFDYHYSLASVQGTYLGKFLLFSTR